MNATSMLPNDMFIADNLEQGWATIERNSKEGRIQRADLAYAAYIKHTTHGERNWLERVALELGLKPGKETGTVISDSVSIFKTFRALPPQGLGYTRDRLMAFTTRKMRAIAQNRTWAINNAERVSELLEDENATEESIRAEIRAAKGKTEKIDTESYERRSLRFISQESSLYDEALQAIEARRVFAGATPGDMNDAFHQGKLILEALQDWLQIETDYLDDEENEISISNADFLPGGGYGLVTDEADDYDVEFISEDDDVAETDKNQHDAA
jgi:hypothetical protein